MYVWNSWLYEPSHILSDLWIQTLDVVLQLICAARNSRESWPSHKTNRLFSLLLKNHITCNIYKYIPVWRTRLQISHITKLHEMKFQFSGIDLGQTCKTADLLITWYLWVGNHSFFMGPNGTLGDQHCIHILSLDPHFKRIYWQKL